MPFARVTIAGADLDQGRIAEIQAGVTALITSILRKRPEVTAVLVEQAPLSGWTVGGQPVPAAGHLEVAITDGTNTEGEKADFIAAAANLLRQALGPLSLATYVIVRQVKADAWGYDGRTQDARRRQS